MTGRRARGFTLLEVMVALAILGMGLTVILSSQAGLFATAQRVRHQTHATNLLRCRMTEIERELLEEGFTILDQKDSGECCEDEDQPGFSCQWSIETIELPQPATFAESPEEALENGEGDIEEALDDPSSAAGPLGALAQIESSQGTVLGENPQTEDLAGMLGATSPAGGGGLISMAMGLVYPDLKPMLEASIRRVTVSVIWREGSKERDFTVVQYVTNPLEGSLNPNADDILENLPLPGGATGPGPMGEEP